MARYPAAGAVKTRLARVIGAERAGQLYQAFLHDLDGRFARGRRALVWAFHPPERDFSSLVRPGSRCIPQLGADLGERMHHCFRLLSEEGYTRTLIIGADAPHLREDWLDEGEAALEEADVVLGPAQDGGYYLIGMRAPHDVFAGIQMGTPTVLADTLAKAERRGLRVHLLPRTFDVDEAADLLRLRQLLANEVDAARLPRTTALLKGWEGWLQSACCRSTSRLEARLTLPKVRRID
jgi:rSAM/selenodomain-associated transferase 1